MIVVAGEALIDLIPSGSGGELGVHPGGGPFNTARWLGRLGADVAFLGTIAADPLGQRLRAELVAAGVSLDLVVPSALPTTLALAQLDAAGAAQYSFYTDGTSAGALGDGDVESLLGVQAVRGVEVLDALYVGGLGLVLEPSADAVARAVTLARSRGAVVMLDPNVRPSLIADRQAYLERLWSVIAQTSVLKLSVDDLEWLAPGEPPRAAARGLLERGPGLVLLTDGAAGATVFSAAGGAGGAEVTIPAVSVRVADTIGAGDAFSAGFLTRWLERGEGKSSWGRLSLPSLGEPEAAAEFAVRVAALACSLRGATPPADLSRVGGRLALGARGLHRPGAEQVMEEPHRQLRRDGRGGGEGRSPQRG